MKSSRNALFLGLCMAASTVIAPAVSMAAVVVDVDVAPPPLRVEEVPVARPGYVWAPGYWEWRHGRHEWVGGRWMGERRGYHWVPDRWDQRGPHYHHVVGHWER